MPAMPRGFHVHLLCAGLLLLLPLAAEAAFTDIDDEHPNHDAIIYLQQKGVVHGFADESFRADRHLNRAEAVKIIAKLLFDVDEINDCTDVSVFKDVEETDWFAQAVCITAQKGIIESSDHSFNPTESLNVSELSAILARAYDLPIGAAEDLWYAPYIRAIGEKQAIPDDIKAAKERVTRGQMAEMMWRLQDKVETRPSADAETVINADCQWFEQEDIPKVDDQEVTRAWMTWVNGERAKYDLAPYRISKQLTRTAVIWSQEARANGAITHKRPGQTAYYDYKIITDWFASLDLEFSNKNRSTFTENIGWGVYSCKKADCTDRFIEAMRSTFDMYMREKDQASRPHYNSMMNNEFTLAGLGIAVDQETGRYYLTAHYGTDITSDPAPICP